MRFMSFGDLGTNERTRLTAAGRLSPSRGCCAVAPVGVMATVERRRCKSWGSVSNQVAAAAAVAIEMKTMLSGSTMASSMSVLDAHQTRDDERSGQLQR